uniref:Uncharacterized protein LOC114343993 n=1 Tax=Diabrotica virgifera virgifera TaxID=50390 RepID=A0A6P7H3R1_DIAVI
MRIVIPLVKSELLSLVKFHKGNIPEGLPLEIMPKEYGGETSSMEELDQVTEHLWEKYRPWLLENETLKTNENKRNQKKSSWWGLPFFGNKEELNEKNIIKNLRYE